MVTGVAVTQRSSGREWPWWVKALIVVGAVVSLAMLAGVVWFTAPAGASAITGVTTMDGSPFMIARSELAAVQDRGQYEWVMCGLIIPGNETPCPSQDVASAASWAMLKRYVLSGKWRTIMFDQEGWRYTPGWEQRQALKYDRLAGEFARAHGVTLIEASVPIGYSTPATRRAAGVTWAAYEARYAPWVDIQDQSLAGDPAAYTAEAKAVMRAVRKVSRTAHVIDNMSTDPGGFVVGGVSDTADQSAAIMRQDFLNTRHVVTAFWYELPVWQPPTPENCQSTGCPAIGLAFLNLLGAS